MNSRIILLITPCLLNPAIGRGGSINGMGLDASTRTNCDIRPGLEGQGRFIYPVPFKCNLAVKDQILDQCYVVVHSSVQPTCGWQTCGSLSVVGEKPKYLNSSIYEYGIPTPAVPLASWGQCDSMGCLPKSPFPRQYLTVRQALERRKLGLKGDGLDVIASVPLSVLKSNSYLSCVYALEPFM